MVFSLVLPVFVLTGPTLPAGAASGRCRVPALIAHRGYPPSGSENTLTSLRRAVAAGAHRLEIDIRFSRDHHPVLMHDATVDRTTDGSGRVAALTLARLRALRGADRLPPPTLDEALKLLRGHVTQVLIDLKVVPDSADRRRLAAAYARHRAYRWAPLMSFQPEALKRMVLPPRSRGLLARSAPPPSLARRYAFVAVRDDQLTRSRVRAYQAAGVPVYAWTPNTYSAWRRLARDGVDGIVTDKSVGYRKWAGTIC
ncbi:glycerophosphodiester phosphodiesterase [Nonomuraea purpurea]|uniref:Glycerophosphodiester phosphodiesterase n=1 Tax=Nonomuraea purpurea TaxID=1849276 RepID=A0ABV8G8E7_9ACTN